MAGQQGWIGVDLDGTLAYYDRWRGITHIGEPIEPMVIRVQQWLAEGRSVRIFTARMAEPDPDVRAKVRSVIEDWCLKYFGRHLLVTNVKDFNMLELWDDRAVHVVPNTGEV
jgi:hypothetical protein